MKRKVLVTLLCLTISACVMACGREAVAEKEPENVVEVQETEELTETQGQQTEVKNETVIRNEEIEMETTENEVEIETEEEETAIEEEIIDASEIAPLSYEDFNVNDNGYSNHIDEYGSEGVPYRIIICDKKCPDELDDNLHNVYDQTTYRGIALGDSREQVLEKYGEPDNEIVYKNHRWDHDGLEAQYNIVYAYIDERYSEVFFGVCFNLDQNDNVLSVYYETTSMEGYTFK